MAGLSDRGRHVASVQVQIDHEILQHFSQHLYSSPNKAIEELVTNGYDALAEEVHVHLPGEITTDSVLVWDNGDSMDVDGIRQLWWIARSPKDDSNDRIAYSHRRDASRAMIGKFGIGKLASYAIGRRISHLCHQDDRYYLIAVDYDEAPRVDSEETRAEGFQVPVVELNETEARDYVNSLYRKTPEGFEEFWKNPTWTLARIDEIKDGVKLTQGRLGWVLGNGMPSRPDFSVFVNDNSVKPKIETGAIAEWDVSEPRLRRQLEKDWKSAVQHGVVSGSPEHSADSDGCPVFRTPVIGDIKVQVKLFERSLHKKGSDDAGRSQGFFVSVRKRLLNPDDPKLLLPDPSFGAFNRMQIFISADGLDGELLADRERLRRDTPSGREIETVQHSIYRAARHFLQEDDSRATIREEAAELPAISREFVRDPLTALIIDDSESDLGKVDPSQTRLTSEQAGDTEPLMRLDSEENRLLTNMDHPLFGTVVQTFGNTKHARQAQKLIELVGFADTLLHGHLLDLGLESDFVDNVLKWRDAQLRVLADGFGSNSDLIAKEVVDASYKGGSRFEQSLAKLFRSMGFAANVDGVPGAKDVLVVAPVGEQEKRFTVEAKGSIRATANDTAEISGASAHAAAVDASFALVVARDFTGFSRESNEDPAVLQECRTQTPPVSISTVSTLVDLYHAVQKHQYPLITISDSLAEIESPKEKVDRVATLRDPLRSNLDWRAIFNEIWQLQQGNAAAEPVSIRQVRQNERWKHVVDDKRFLQLLAGLESLSGGLIKVYSNESDVNLFQSPELVAERIISKLEGDSHSQSHRA